MLPVATSGQHFTTQSPLYLLPKPLVFQLLRKNSKRNNKTKVLYCTDVLIWHQSIHSTYKMTPTYVRYMLQVFFCLFSLFCVKLILIYKGNKGRCKESIIRGHRKNLSPSRSDALTSELLRTRLRARVIFVGRTCVPHLAVTQSITGNT